MKHHLHLLLAAGFGAVSIGAAAAVHDWTATRAVFPDPTSSGAFNRSLQHLRFKELQWEHQSMAAADEVFVRRWVRSVGPRLVSGKIGSVFGRLSPKG